MGIFRETASKLSQKMVVSFNPLKMKFALLLCKNDTYFIVGWIDN